MCLFARIHVNYANSLSYVISEYYESLAISIAWVAGLLTDISISLATPFAMSKIKFFKIYNHRLANNGLYMINITILYYIQ